MAVSLKAFATKVGALTADYFDAANTLTGDDTQAITEFGLSETPKYTLVSTTLNDVTKKAEQAAEGANR